MNSYIKRELILHGLECANCASKIEHDVKQLEDIDSASMNFINKTLTVEMKPEAGIEEIVDRIKDIVFKYEPGVRVSTVENYKSEHSLAASDDQSRNIVKDGKREELIRLIAGAVIFCIAFVSNFSYWVEFAIYFISYIIVGGDVLLKAARTIIGGRIFDENFLMSIATIGAFAIGQFPEGVAVMLFYQLGEFIQGAAVNRSRKSISSLMDIRPEYANLKKDNNIEKVSPYEVSIGDLIVVKPGEKIPLDGKVVEGQSMVDASVLTGESVPRETGVGDEVLSGCINKNGLLVVQVGKEFGESTVSRILDLVQNASSRKAPTENFITKFARYYTPVVVIIAAVLAIFPPLIIQGAIFSEWIYRALVFLVISCPCALVISIPLGFFGGIGGAARKGILVKGSNYLEALNDVDIVVFDKTGTLTKGVFKVTEIRPQNEMTEDELLEYAAYAEYYSSHPAALSIVKGYGKEIYKDEIEGYNEIPGYGIKAVIRSKEILAGNIKLMNAEGIAFDEVDAPGTVIHIAVDKRYSGYILISDEVKEDSKDALRALKNAGVKKTVMLTGDNRAIADMVSKQLGVDEYRAELLPDQKVEILESLDRGKGILAFVGDGINDAPVLARADVGIAMGGLGSDAAIEAADVVIMTDEPSKLVSAIKIAKRTRKIVWQNIIFALGIKLIFLGLGAVGIAEIWEAVFADVGVTVIAVINSMRSLNVRGIK